MRIPIGLTRASGTHANREQSAEKQAPSSAQGRTRQSSPLFSLLPNRQNDARSSRSNTQATPSADKTANLRSRLPAAVELRSAQLLMQRPVNRWTRSEVSAYGQAHGLQPMEKFLDKDGNPTVHGKPIMAIHEKRMQTKAKFERLEKTRQVLNKVTLGLSDQMYERYTRQYNAALKYEFKHSPYSKVREDLPQHALASVEIWRSPPTELPPPYEIVPPEYDELSSSESATPSPDTNRLPRSSSLR